MVGLAVRERLFPLVNRQGSVVIIARGNGRYALHLRENALDGEAVIIVFGELLGGFRGIGSFFLGVIGRLGVFGRFRSRDILTNVAALLLLKLYRHCALPKLSRGVQHTGIFLRGYPRFFKGKYKRVQVHRGVALDFLYRRFGRVAAL